MRRIRSPQVWIPLAVSVLLIAVALSVLLIRAVRLSPDSLCSKRENADGIIDSIDRRSGDGVLRLYDPTQKTFPPGMGRVSLLVTVDASTRIFRQEGTVCQVLQRVSFYDLRVGQKLKVWSRSGIVITTYPGQLTDPADIVIVSWSVASLLLNSLFPVEVSIPAKTSADWPTPSRVLCTGK